MFKRVILFPMQREMRCALNTKSFQFLMLAKYMMNVLNIRSEEIVDPPFDGIDDPRNGILLNPAFHRGFGGISCRISTCQLLL
jgi:hypothetical protein